jgi:integrase
MLVKDFWEKVLYPILARRLARNSKVGYKSAWRVHIEPAIGGQELQHVIKHAIETILGEMAEAGKGQSLIKRVLSLMHEMFAEAVENRYVARNPARRIMLPNCRGHQQTVARTDQQVLAIFDNTEGRDRLMWRILLLTGLRPGELVALQKSDLIPAGLLIDESTTWGQVGPTNCAITRCASPRAFGMAGGVEGHLMFPSPRGKLLRLSSEAICDMLDRTRRAAGISGLTFRQCRTTFATPYEGDAKDRQAILGHSDSLTSAPKTSSGTVSGSRWRFTKRRFRLGSKHRWRNWRRG